MAAKRNVWNVYFANFFFFIVDVVDRYFLPTIYKSLVIIFFYSRDNSRKSVYTGNFNSTFRRSLPSRRRNTNNFILAQFCGIPAEVCI